MMMNAQKTVEIIKKRRSNPLLLPTLALILLGLSCTNSGRSVFKQSNKNPGPSPSNNSPAFFISSVTIGPPQQGGNRLTTISFNTSTSAPINTACSVGGSLVGESCFCRFIWTSSNSETGTSFTRTVESPLTSVLAFSASCDAPAVYDSEIPDQTMIDVSIVPQSAVSSLFMTPFGVQKGGPFDSNGDFTGAGGLPFVNIHRYSCFEVSTKGKSVRSRPAKASNQNRVTGDQNVPLASSWCIDGISNDADCVGVTTGVSKTQQSYYYDLYLPSDERNLFSPSNNRYECPEVNTPINEAFTVGGRSPWPSDATFALAEFPSPDFPLGIEAPARLDTGAVGGALNGSTTCAGQFPGPGQSPTPPVAGNGNGFNTRCIGFAALPSPSGACPTTVINNNGTQEIRPTYRLRRYRAIYPNQFTPDGASIEQPIAENMIYVLDRPVISANPVAPYSMLGPKPCPFAYFDRSGVLAIDPDDSNPAITSALYQGGMPVYRGTNHVISSAVNADADDLLRDSDWDRKNVDGSFFPNFDNPGTDSCASIFPLVTYDPLSGDPLKISLATSHPSNTNSIPLSSNNSIYLGKVFVRPQRSWAPHYEEDTSFKACALPADPYIDAPLHFAKDASGQIAYCAESYPTQNGRLGTIDNALGSGGAPLGYVKSYTSHAVKNSNSAACSPVLPTLPSNYPPPSNQAPSCKVAGGGNTTTFDAARHPAGLKIGARSPNPADNLCANESCDRNVILTTLWDSFPLLAPEEDVERALVSDSSYRCTVTWDAGQGKAGVSTPSSGCCGPGIVNNLTTGGTGQLPTNAAHLEPAQNTLPACTPPSH